MAYWTKSPHRQGTGKCQGRYISTSALGKSNGNQFTSYNTMDKKPQGAGKMHCHEDLHPLLLKRNLALRVNRAWRWQLMAGLSNVMSKTSRNTFYFCTDLSFKASCCCVLHHVPMLSIIVFAYYLYDSWIFFLHRLYAGSKELWAHYCRWWEFHRSGDCRRLCSEFCWREKTESCGDGFHEYLQ